jgi:hypothetical protein
MTEPRTLDVPEELCTRQKKGSTTGQVEMGRALASEGRDVEPHECLRASEGEPLWWTTETIEFLTYDVSVAAHLTSKAPPRSQQGESITDNSRWISLAPMKCSICEDGVIRIGGEV